MADVSKDDLRAALSDAVRDIKNEFHSMRDQVQRIDKRTDDLDQSQHEIRELFTKIERLYPKLEELVHQTDEIMQINHNVEDIRLRTQNVERGVAAITQYLRDTHASSQQEAGYKNA